MYEIECVADYACLTGEGPLWHPQEQRVYWTDIPAGRMFRYDPATGDHEHCYEGEQVGGFTFQEDGALLLFMARGAIKVWRDGFVRTVVEELPHERDSRFNDVIADPHGRVFCGTMTAGDKPGRLYRLDLDGTLTVILDGLGCPNGMGFTADRQTMYFTDSGARAIYAFDYDVATGDLTRQRVLVETAEGEGVPDGMTVDVDERLWSARWDGGCMVQYDAQGHELQRVELPARKVSSVVFGGPDYADAYVTTAGGANKETEGSGAGGLFRVRGLGRGVPEFHSRIS